MTTVSLIMAGGKGERFWPLSRENYPKQLLKIHNNHTMIQMAIERLQKNFEDRIFIVSNENLAEKIQVMNKELSKENFFVEPMRKNTAPCLIYSMIQFEKMYGEDCIAFIGTADHHIGNLGEFENDIDYAIKCAEKKDVLITLGVTPNRVEAGYGYIKKGDRCKHDCQGKVYQVAEFKEKPDFQTARTYYKSGEYLWNSGMFIWKIKTFKDLLKKHNPDLYKWYEYMLNSSDESEYSRRVYEFFQQVEPISIDYALLEKTSEVMVIQSSFSWDDLGTWTALERVIAPDENNNIFKGTVFAQDSYDNLVFSESKPVTLFGVENLVIVEANDLIFACPKSKIPFLKEYLKKMKEVPDFNKFV